MFDLPAVLAYSLSIIMEPFGVLGCVQLTGALIKRVGPSDHSKKDLNEISIAICGFQCAYGGLISSYTTSMTGAVGASAFGRSIAGL